MIDNYCERTDPSFWAEPINALSNGAFILAALLTIRLRNAQGARDVASVWLAGWLLLIGIGSFLFHTLATAWSAAADVIPIYLFKLSFLWLYPRQVLRWSVARTLALFAVFIAGSVAMSWFPWDINGSQSYLPAATILGVFAALHVVKQHPAPNWLCIAAAVFLISLVARSVDMRLCDVWPVGTHFLWHCLNAVVLYGCYRSWLLARHQAD